MQSGALLCHTHGDGGSSQRPSVVVFAAVATFYLCDRVCLLLFASASHHSIIDFIQFQITRYGSHGDVASIPLKFMRDEVMSSRDMEITVEDWV